MCLSMSTPPDGACLVWGGYNVEPEEGVRMSGQEGCLQTTTPCGPTNGTPRSLATTAQQSMSPTSWCRALANGPLRLSMAGVAPPLRRTWVLCLHAEWRVWGMAQTARATTTRGGTEQPFAPARLFPEDLYGCWIWMRWPVLGGFRRRRNLRRCGHLRGVLMSVANAGAQTPPDAPTPWPATMKTRTATTGTPNDCGECGGPEDIWDGLRLRRRCNFSMGCNVRQRRMSDTRRVRRVRRQRYLACTDSLACNYDAGASCDDGSCLFDDALGVCGGTCAEDADADGICDACIEEEGYRLEVETVMEHMGGELDGMTTYRLHVV